MSGFKPYSAYKDSGVEWLGEVPKDWTALALSRVLAAPVTDGPHTTPEFLDDGVPFLSVDGIQDGKLNFEGCRYVSFEDHKEFSKKAAPRHNDLLMGKAASVGKIARVTEDVEFSIWSPLALIRVDTGQCRPEFLEFCLKSSELQYQILLASNSNTQLNIGMKDIPKLRIPLPAVQEQDQIACFLDHETARIDALIAEQQRLIELLKEKRQAVISHAVTKGLDPTVPMKDSGVEWLGEVPAHWEVTKLKWPLRTASGGTPPSNDRAAYYDGGIPWLRSLDLTDDLITEYEVTVTQRAIEETSCKIVPKNSVLIAMYGGDGTIGKNGILTFDSAINQAICAFLPSERCSSEYLHRYIQFYRPYWMIGAESSRKDPNIGQDRIGDHFLMLPPLQEQAEIAGFVSVELLKLTALVKEAQMGVEFLQERRSALISAAVTGKIDVRGWQPPASAPTPELVQEAV